ncbi:MAG TPA: CvpA family protein [Candidatus Magasanikbacteria bacterium]|nr:CvpA family protein [Candidatus Magasanikbacteria bacterium]
MNFLDIIIIITVAIFALMGLWLGLLHTIGSLFGTVVGAYIASRYYEGGAQWLMNTVGWGENVSRVVMFIAIFFIITRAIGAAFWLIGKVGGMIIPIPFKQVLNRFLGMIVGAAEGILTVGLVLYFIDKFPLGDRVMDSILSSTFAPSVIAFASILIPLFPEALKALETTVDKIESSL